MTHHGYEINHPKDGPFIINIQNPMKKKIVVIGSGIFGVSTAFKLLGAGQRVTLIDHPGKPDEIPHIGAPRRTDYYAVSCVCSVHYRVYRAIATSQAERQLSYN